MQYVNFLQKKRRIEFNLINMFEIIFLGYYIIYTVFVTVTVNTILNRVAMLNWFFILKVTLNKITFNYADWYATI